MPVADGHEKVAPRRVIWIIRIRGRPHSGCLGGEAANRQFVQRWALCVHRTESSRGLPKEDSSKRPSSTNRCSIIFVTTPPALRTYEMPKFDLRPHKTWFGNEFYENYLHAGRPEPNSGQLQSALSTLANPCYFAKFRTNPVDVAFA